MEPLKPDHRCRKCLRGLVENALDLAGTEKGSPERAGARRQAFDIIEEGIALGTPSPVTANRMQREISGRFGVKDPYAGPKRYEMEKARSVLTSVAPYINEEFRNLVCLAALGNTLDFFRDTRKVLEEIPSLLAGGIRFGRDDLSRLERFLDTGRTKKILYLTDNAGEIYFDLRLYEALLERTSSCTLVVKGGPALNDLTREDLVLSGLTGRIRDLADTGTDGPGIDWERVSPRFLSLVEEADLIFAKGMANFETVSPKPLKASSFYLFRVKCEPIRKMSGVALGEFAAVFKEAARP
jgi:damage-control phosphatase, subfamily I